MWLVTTLEAADYRVLWEMHAAARWDIEETWFPSIENVLSRQSTVTVEMRLKPYLI